MKSLRTIYQQQRARMWRRRTARILAVLAALLLMSGVYVYATMLADLPSVSELESRRVRPTTRILDREGRLLYEIMDPDAGKQIDLAPAQGSGDSQGRYGLADVPDFCVQAALATEDSRFFLHPGVDPIAIARAAWQNWRAGGVIVSGGSTLTQQVARNLFLEPSERYERTLRRKIREAWLALHLEWRYSKAEILALYLNQTYYGHFAFGLEAAAQNFFAKPAADLSRAECALLAGLVQYPGGYNPFLNPDAAKARQQTVLRLMQQARYVDQAEASLILADPLRYRSRLFQIMAPHFVVYVNELLLREVGLARLQDGGLDVITTLDLGLQRRAEESVRHRLVQLNCQWIQGNASCAQAVSATQAIARNAAALVMDAQSGEILAWVGSPDYFNPAIDGNFDGVISQRQPGSAIKPLTYAAALDPEWSAQAGLAPLTPASILPDLPTAFPGGRGEQSSAEDGDETGVYLPKNYNLRYHGPVSVREALANSYNIPAVHVLQRVGVQSLQNIATQAGISTFTGEYGLALTLGGGEVSLLELTAAYGIFPRQGNRLEPRAILSIHARGQGSQLCCPPPDPSAQANPVIRGQTAFLINDILSDPVARLAGFGEDSVLNLPWPAAAKTGTTTDWRDNWTVGYSTQRLVGVWVGNADNQPMQGVTGIDGAGPIWRDLMLAAHPSPPRPFARPEGLRQLTICAGSGLLPTPECPRQRREFFIAGTEPTQPDNQFQRVEIDLATGLRATEQTPPERRQSRVYRTLPPQYAAWMAAQGLPQIPPFPADRQALSTGSGEGAAQADSSQDRPDLILAEPVANSVFAIHPGVPRERQRLQVSGYTLDGEAWAMLRLMVNGVPLAEGEGVTRLSQWWTLESGQHRFWMEGEKTAGHGLTRSNEVHLVVE